VLSSSLIFQKTFVAEMNVFIRTSSGIFLFTSVNDLKRDFSVLYYECGDDFVAVNAYGRFVSCALFDSPHLSVENNY